MTVHKKSPDPSTLVPSEVRPKYEAITALTDAICKRHLNDDKMDIAFDHLTLLIAKVRGDVKLTNDLNIQSHLDSMYDQMKRLVDELSQSPRKDDPEST